MNTTLEKQKTINLISPIPGPKSQAVLKRRADSTPAGLAKSTDVVVADAKGAVIKDVDGNTLLDFAGAIGVMNIGHCAPAVVKAIQEQAEKYIHTCALVTTFEPMIELCELLNKVTPGNFPKKTLLANSGSEAVENAVNISRYYTKRKGVICFEGGYHGRTLLTLSLTSKHGLFKKGFGPFGGDIYRLPSPNVYRKPDQMTEEEYIDFSIKNLRNALISQVDVSDLAAILIEPVQGEGGFIPMPKAFLQEIRNICNESGAVMICDEIQSGFGRTGKLFACEHYEIAPDIITTAKSLGAGLPISATVGKAEIMDSVHLGGVGGTYGGPNAKLAKLTLPDGTEYELKLGNLDPVDEITGIQGRLSSLGVYDGSINGQLDDKTKIALALFQSLSELEVTGEADERTKDLLTQMSGK